MMVVFSSRFSRATSTVILRDRSPRATAGSYPAMLRTWPVTISASTLTESVRSFHVPARRERCLATQAPFAGNFARYAGHLAAKAFS